MVTRLTILFNYYINIYKINNTVEVNNAYKNKLVFSGFSGNLAETIANKGSQAAMPLAVLPVELPDGFKMQVKAE